MDVNLEPMATVVFTRTFGHMGETKVEDGSRSLAVLLWATAALILTQAILAGLFISAAAPARTAHLVVGSLLPWLAIAPAVVALIERRRLSPPLVTGAVLLPVGLWVQEVLGHMPFAVTTAIHVPLGVALFATSVVLALASGRRRAAVEPV